VEHVRFEPISAERCVQEAERLRSEAQQLPPGPEQQELIRKARQRTRLRTSMSGCATLWPVQISLRRLLP
jgi:hypothetical protein